MFGSSLIANFLLTMNGPRMGYHVLQRFTKETLESFSILSLRIRSNTARSRFLQSFATQQIGEFGLWCYVVCCVCSVV